MFTGTLNLRKLLAFGLLGLGTFTSTAADVQACDYDYRVPVYPRVQVYVPRSYGYIAYRVDVRPRVYIPVTRYHRPY